MVSVSRFRVHLQAHKNILSTEVNLIISAESTGLVFDMNYDPVFKFENHKPILKITNICAKFSRKIRSFILSADVLCRFVSIHSALVIIVTFFRYSYRRRANPVQNRRSASWRTWRAGNSIRSTRSGSCWLPRSSDSGTWNSMTPNTIKWRPSTSDSAGFETGWRRKNKSSASSGRSGVKWTRRSSTTLHSVSIHSPCTHVATVTHCTLSRHNNNNNKNNKSTTYSRWPCVLNAVPTL